MTEYMQQHWWATALFVMVGAAVLGWLSRYVEDVVRERIARRRERRYER